MSKLLLLIRSEAAKALTKAGFQVARQKGSHLILVKNENIVPVPKDKEIKRGLLMAIISEAGLTKEEFLTLLKQT